MTRGPLWWTAAALGFGLIAWGVIGAVTTTGRYGLEGEGLRSTVTWFFGGLLLHDVVVSVIVAVVGTLLAGKITRTWLRDAITWALWTGALVIIVFWPAIGGLSTAADRVPSILPRNYVTGAVIALLVIVAIAAGRALGKRRSQRA